MSEIKCSECKKDLTCKECSHTFVHDPKKLADHAEEYINRIRGFQNSLLHWLVTWNIALIGAAAYSLFSAHELRLVVIFSLVAIFWNIICAFIYQRHRSQTKRIINNHIPEIDSKDQYEGKVWKIMQIAFSMWMLGCLAIASFSIGSLLQGRPILFSWVLIGILGIACIGVFCYVTFNKKPTEVTPSKVTILAIGVFCILIALIKPDKVKFGPYGYEKSAEAVAEIVAKSDAKIPGFDSNIEFAKSILVDLYGKDTKEYRESIHRLGFYPSKTDPKKQKGPIPLNTPK